METLRNCPFCGGEAEIIKRPVYTYLKPYDPETAAKKYYIQCTICATQYGAIDYDTEEEAIAGWNRRSGGWISVAERLPEEGEFLLGWHEEGLVVLTTNMFDELENVTHWMPLPEPPEGAEK